MSASKPSDPRPTHRAARVAAALLLGLATTGVTPPARAQPDAAQLTPAETLFREGKKLRDEQKYAEAALALEKSDKLEPAPGTEFFLADCYEKMGQLAKAWALFKAVANKTTRPEQIDETLARAAAIEPQLAKLIIVVPGEVAALNGLTISRDKEEVPRRTWGAVVPVDPKTHVVKASAPKMEPWTRVVTATRGATIVVNVPPFVEASRSDAPPLAFAPLSGAPAGQDGVRSTGSVLRTTALALGGIGVLGLGVGSIFGIQALTKQRDLRETCPNYPHCPVALAQGMQTELHEKNTSAVTMADVSTGTFVASGALLAAAAVVWALSPSRPKSAQAGAHVGPQSSISALRILPNGSSSSAGGILLGTF